ncbi:AAA family ATPase [Cognatitamlana onchidii]|uniref:AAA family ATPase n=1 Tax=Cognatitamlana onchidii TaxID=2562860 RepID=UPI0010A6ACB9|nr:ATP-binding protein [Algibacter onchidii]
MSIKKIVITGSAGTGKTSVINNLKTKGYYCFDEFIRELTSETKKEVDASNHVSNPIVFAKDSLEFNSRLLKGRIDQFNKADNTNKNICFFDRGIPDVLAYMDVFNQAYNATFIEACTKHQYTSVFLLPPWKAIYKTDSGRFESFEEVLKIHNQLESTYTKLGYPIIKVPFGTVEERTRFIINHI